MKPNSAEPVHCTDLHSVWRLPSVLVLLGTYLLYPTGCPRATQCCFDEIGCISGLCFWRVTSVYIFWVVFSHQQLRICQSPLISELFNVAAVLFSPLALSLLPVSLLLQLCFFKLFSLSPSLSLCRCLYCLKHHFILFPMHSAPSKGDAIHFSENTS